MLLERLAGAQDLYHEMHKVAQFETGKTGVWRCPVTLGPLVLSFFIYKTQWLDEVIQSAFPGLKFSVCEMYWC